MILGNILYYPRTLSFLPNPYSTPSSVVNTTVLLFIAIQKTYLLTAISSGNITISLFLLTIISLSHINAPMYSSFSFTTS
jgi:hypothetical protein